LGQKKVLYSPEEMKLYNSVLFSEYSPLCVRGWRRREKEKRKKGSPCTLNRSDGKKKNYALINCS